MKKVLVVMGSDSDLKVMEKCVDRLKSFDIPVEVRICSAHRTRLSQSSLRKMRRRRASASSSRRQARQRIWAAFSQPTPRSRSSACRWPPASWAAWTACVSIVQMPKGIPVATVAIDGADNAAILAAQMIALSDETLAARLAAFKADMAAEVTAKDEKVRAQFA